MNTDYTLYKLIVLYILDNVDFPLTNSQITDFILDKEYTTYFIIQQTMAELEESKFILRDTIRNSSRYSISEEGRETLGFLDYKISDAIKEEVKQYLRDNSYTLKDKNSSIAYYMPSTTSNDYVVNLRVKEDNSTLIDLSLTVPSEEMAIKMCDNWKEKSPDIYAYLFKTLQNIGEDSTNEDSKNNNNKEK